MIFEENKTIAFRPTDDALALLNELANQMQTENKSQVMNEAIMRNAQIVAALNSESELKMLNESLKCSEEKIDELQNQLKATQLLLEEEKNKVSAFPSLDAIMEQMGLSKEKFNELMNSAQVANVAGPSELKANECIVSFEKEEQLEIGKLRSRLIKLSLASETDEPQAILKLAARVANENIDAYLNLIETFKPLIQ
jgi:hypothetical protein